MPTRCREVILIILVLLLTMPCGAETPNEQVGKWSEAHDMLKARLILKHRFTATGYSKILVYLELSNTCPPEGTVWIKHKIE